ncbi:hypothetical protein CJ030_MR0G005096 [Morella rubra]|uniref:Uncharacterized protein n=1 Tax=Morella rubra TaxID=262757 RepID=A0A6A1UMF3_9ROSI|nr:hypothetical protein CJ030_MR0G005096 [Morella rubra]
MHGTLFTTRGMPEWFSNTSCGTSDITLAHDLDNNRKWIGYAVFIDYEVYDLHQPRRLDVIRPKEATILFRKAYDCWMGPNTWLLNYFHFADTSSNVVMFKWVLRSINGRHDIPIDQGLHFFAPEFRNRTDARRGIWAYIPAEWFMEQFTDLERLSDITTSISTSRTIHLCGQRYIAPPKIKKWGAGIVYEDNATEFFSSIAPPGLEPEFYNRLSYYFGKCTLGVIPPLPSIDLSVQERTSSVATINAAFVTFRALLIIEFPDTCTPQNLVSNNYFEKLLEVKC